MKAEMDITFQQQLFRYIDEKGLTEVDAYKRSFVDRRNFSKIRSNKDYSPKKTTAFCFCLGLGLDMEESNNLLMKAGYYLSKSSRFDLIIICAIDNKIYNALMVNEIL